MKTYLNFPTKNQTLYVKNKTRSLCMLFDSVSETHSIRVFGIPSQVCRSCNPLTQSRAFYCQKVYPNEIKLLIFSVGSPSGGLWWYPGVVHWSVGVYRPGGHGVVGWLHHCDHQESMSWEKTENYFRYDCTERLKVKIYYMSFRLIYDDMSVIMVDFCGQSSNVNKNYIDHDNECALWSF